MYFKKSQYNWHGWIMNAFVTTSTKVDRKMIDIWCGMSLLEVFCVTFHCDRFNLAWVSVLHVADAEAGRDSLWPLIACTANVTVYWTLFATAFSAWELLLASPLIAPRSITYNRCRFTHWRPLDYGYYCPCLKVLRGRPPPPPNNIRFWMNRLTNFFSKPPCWSRVLGCSP